jgi:nucleoside-diphosphate-sugar epimerase
MSINHFVLGTGTIGRSIMQELVGRGEAVRMVNRSGMMEEAPEGVEIVTADLYDSRQVWEVTNGARVVYQAAQPNYNEWPQKFPALQKSIIDGLTGNGTKLVIVENLYMYGELNGKPLSEDMPYNAHTCKGRVRLELSEAALSAHQDGRVRVTIGRSSDYFGPWGTGTSMGSTVFWRVLAGKAAQVAGSTKVPHTHTFIPDFAKALIVLGERPEADGQAWHVPNDMPRITQGKLVHMIAEEAGETVKIQTAGKLTLSLLGMFIPEL